MPTSAFDPGAGNATVAAKEGHEEQPAAIETEGGFVIKGGASTQRAAGSAPDSPSSTLAVPAEAVAAADAGVADEGGAPDGTATAEATVDPSASAPDPAATDLAPSTEVDKAAEKGVG